jgi:hypothetical protein
MKYVVIVKFNGGTKQEVFTTLSQGEAAQRVKDILTYHRGVVECYYKVKSI